MSAVNLITRMHVLPTLRSLEIVRNGLMVFFCFMVISFYSIFSSKFMNPKISAIVFFIIIIIFPLQILLAESFRHVPRTPWMPV
jgi:hypothetical protein